ncbi:hypothetical protein [Pelagibius sp.]|uniref:hypothetical protein n=1 Tax=Pelagibius sp. TaxID=1931238 RepID=UPI003BAFB7D3
MFQQFASPEDLNRETLACKTTARETKHQAATVTARQSRQAESQPADQRDPFIEHYFKRIDPKMAASFSEEQCAAIKQMFGARGIAKHAVELRRSIPIGRRRFYLVLLMGREQRTFNRLFSEGTATRSFAILGYAITAALWLIPAVALAFALQALL